MRKSVSAICEQQMRSLISAFAVHCLDSIISLVSLSEISSFYLISMTAQTGLSTLVTNPKDRFSRDEAHLFSNCCSC